MTETRDFQCPNCGSPLNLPGDDAYEVKCPYCGSVVIVPETLRTHKAPPPPPAPVFTTPKYTFEQYDDQFSKQVSTVGKVATGIAVSTAIAPIVITGVILCIVGVFVAFILFSVNTTIKSAADSF